MNSKSENQIHFFEILENNAWHKEDDQMYSPHGTFWLSCGETLSVFLIERMHENAKNNLDKIEENSHFHFDKQAIKNWADDLKNFIEITEKIIAEQSTEIE